MSAIHPSAVVPVAVTWLAIVFMFGLACYFAFFAPASEAAEEEPESSTASEGGKG